MNGTPLVNANVLGDWLRFEEDCRYSRDNIVVVSGSGALATGTVLGKITASGKYAPHNPDGIDGTEAAAGILVHDVDATSADAEGVAVVRHAHIAPSKLAWAAGVDATEQGTALADLKLLGILTVREV